jgi:hypothetical protein
MMDSNISNALSAIRNIANGRLAGNISANDAAQIANALRIHVQTLEAALNQLESAPATAQTAY